jgi:branched-subunit amino acid transport protein AzlD
VSVEVLALCLLAGAANYAFRVLPMHLPLFRNPPQGAFGRFLTATGPAAIATLTAASLWPMAAADAARAVPLAAGIAAVLGLWLWRRSVVLATLGGPVAYAAALAALA